MNKEQIKQWAQEASRAALQDREPWAYERYFARLVRAAALEEARIIARSYLGGSVIADAIDALKEPRNGS